jgi:arylformamidase
LKFYDVTAPIYKGMTVYKNKPEKQPEFNRVTNGHVTETRMALDVHTGTHIDAPLHMINDGETFETVPLEKLIGDAKVIDLLHVKEKITKEDLVKFDIKKNDFVLFKTTNSLEETFNFDFIFLEKTGAEYLAEIGVRGVGVDALGVERAQPDHDTHRALFSKGVIIIEGLRLKDVPTGTYHMVAAPLKLIGTDASPARVLLFNK